jgi:MFS family permease
MSRLTAHIGSGIAVALAFFFWWINNIYQTNGVGLLRRQAWPINSPWAWAAVGFAIGTFGAFVGALHRADHARKTRELAETLGREYAESYALPLEARSLPVFEDWSNGRNAMSAREGGRPVALFDYATVSRGESSTVTDGTAVLLPADGVPPFDLRPRTFGRRLLGWAGLEGLTFDPSTADPADADTIQRFTELFYLASMGPAAALDELAENQPPQWPSREEAIRRLFTPALMEVINRYPEYAIESRDGFLVVWRGSGVLPAHKRAELWDTAIECRALLTHPPERKTETIIPGRAGMDAGRQFRRLRNTVVGGVVGSFIGFILSAMAISIVFFGRVQGQGPGFGFFIEPLLFFGLILGGAMIGAAIASWLPVGKLPSERAEDPERRKARQQATVFAAVIGFLTGFFGGFAVFAINRIVVDWKFDFGMEAALFFGSIFGGGLMGALIGGLAVNRWYRWRRS